jgi:glycosyltransferase involved in cell wall biosynthesis
LTLELSFIFPCLNEERSLETCVSKVRSALDNTSITYEIVVADNGSTDLSRDIALKLGCEVVPVAVRGYGAALRGGILAAKGTYVMFADCDDTYLYQDAPALYRAAVASCADMSIASRMNGVIETGAMPSLHRYLGTPVLTWLINILFCGSLSDCNSGFRCVRREAFVRWNVRSTGMEFASELLIKALKANATTVEIKSGLRCGPPDRQAHLRTWRDGMRHLLFILSEKPALFEIVGLVTMIPALILQFVAWCFGPIKIGGMGIFDLHSQSILLMAGLVGVQLYVFGCSLYLSSGDRPMRITAKLIQLNEGTLFFLLLGVLFASACMVTVLFAVWAASGYQGIHQANTLLFLVHILGTAGMAGVGLLSVHTLKKAFSTSGRYSE